jgi:hypothetical protein
VVIIIVSVVTLSFNWPLASNLNSASGDPYDAPVQAWAMDWVQHAIVSDSDVFEANIFAPTKSSLTFSDALIGVAVPGLLARAVGVEPIGIHNLTLLVGVALNALAAYWLGKLLTGRVMGAATCAIAYAFAPSAVIAASPSALIGLPVHIIVRPGLPIAVGIVWMLADRRRPRLTPSPDAGSEPSGGGNGPLLASLVAVVAWQGTVSFYSAAFCGLAVGAATAVRAKDLGWKGLVRIGLALVVAAIPVVLLALPYFANRRRYESYGFSLADVGQLSPQLSSFWSTDSSFRIWGELLDNDGPFDLNRALLFPGAVVVLLALLGLLTGVRSKEQGDRAVVHLGAALTVVGGALAMGASNTGWRRFSPFRLIYEFVPGGEGLRATSRFWVVGLLGLGVLAAVGASWLIARMQASDSGLFSGRSFVSLSAVLLLTVMTAEGYRSVQVFPIATRSSDRALAELKPGGVVYLPITHTGRLDISVFEQAEFVYRSTAHHRKIVNGKGSFYPPSYLQMSKRVQSLPSAAARNCLLANGIRYVVVTRRVDGSPWADLRDPALAAPMELVGRYEEELVYEVPGEPQAPCELDGQ